jgi:type IV fimbrial biogenesis protein FimT
MAIKRQQGFSLIELMVTVAIASILVSVGVPSFNNMIQNSRQSSTYNAMVSELSYARSEAVKRANFVTICARATDTTCANTATWNDGWLIFIDSVVANGSIDTGEEIIRVTGELNDSQSLTSNSFSNQGFVQYQSRGNTDSTGYFVVCDERGADRAKAVNIVLTGAIRKGVDTNSNDIVENLAGADVTCP